MEHISGHDTAMSASVSTECVSEEKQKGTEHIGVTPECGGIVSTPTLSPTEVHSVCYKCGDMCQCCITERL
jgi:hypothetical protein